MIRWFLSLFGPRCHFGTGFRQAGCLRRATWQSHGPFGWTYNWCERHYPYGSERIVRRSGEGRP